MNYSLKRTFSLFLILVAVVVPMTFSAKGDDTTLNDYAVKVGQFDRLNVLDNVNVVYRICPDSTGYVSYRAVDDFADAFIFTLKGNTLKVQVTTEDVGKPGLPTVYVYSDFLTYVSNSSEFSVTVDECAPCPEFSVNQIGNGSITVEGIKANKVTAKISTGKGVVNLSGEAQEAVYKMIGAGTIQADRLKAGKVKCQIIGAGTIGCWPVESLFTSGIGSTKVYYKGNPTVKKKGGGKLFSIPEERPAGIDADDYSDIPEAAERVFPVSEEPADEVEENNPADDEEAVEEEEDDENSEGEEGGSFEEEESDETTKPVVEEE